MSWHGIEGHDSIVQRFRTAVRRGRLGSTFLFVGPAGIGKKTVALKLAQALLCETHPEQALDPCGNCPACQQILAGSHPDVELISKPADKNFIPVELFIGDREHRMREGLCHAIALKPYSGRRKIAIIDDADFLNQEGANCLLKTLEEPPPNCLIILVGTSEHKQLPTIRSRSQIVRFQPLTERAVADLLVKLNHVVEREEAARLAEFAQGSIERAVELAGSQLWEFRAPLLEQLCEPDVARNEFAKELASFVDKAGKEAPPRRLRMIQVIDLAADFYRQLMRALSGCKTVGDDLMKDAVVAARKSWLGDEETASACLDRCLQARDEVLSNANQATLLECWIDDLSNIALLAEPAAAQPH